MGNESDIVKSCLQWLQAHGCFVWRNNTGRKGHVRFGKPGSADIIGMTPQGKFIAVECKVPGKNLEPEQITFRNNVVVNRGVFVLARGVDDLEASKADMGVM